MAFKTLDALRQECDLDDGVCSFLPSDSVVLFSVRGRCDPKLITEYFNIAVGIDPESILRPSDIRTLHDFCPVVGDDQPIQRFELLRSLVSKPFRETLAQVFKELSANALTYGMDAIRVVNVEEAYNHGMAGETAIFSREVSIQANSYGAVALAYSPSQNMLSLLAHNYVTDSAATGLEERLTDIMRPVGTRSRVLKRNDPGQREPDYNRQPLLRVGEAIGSFLAPVQKATEPVLFDSARTGLRQILRQQFRRTGEPVIFGHQRADLETLGPSAAAAYLAGNDHPLTDVKAAVTAAAEKLGLMPEQVRSFTVAVRFPAASRS